MNSKYHEFNGFSANALKYYAIVAMLIDHIAWTFVSTYSVLGQIMHIIGRTTAPIMCYFLVEGFHNTHNLKKYLNRMGIFALVSYPAYLFHGKIIYFDNGIKVLWLSALHQSMIYTLLICLLILTVKHKCDYSAAIKTVLYIFLFLCALLGDWSVIAPVWVLMFDEYRGDYKKQAIAFLISSLVMITAFFIFQSKITEFLFQYSVILALIPLSFYNGKRSNINKKISLTSMNKWFFYIFYPLHMIIIGFLSYVI